MQLQIAHSLVAQLSTEFIIRYTFLRQVTKSPSCPERRLAGPHEHYSGQEGEVVNCYRKYSKLSIQCSVVLERSVPLEFCKNG